MKSLRSQLPEAVEDKLDTMRNTDDSYWILCGGGGGVRDPSYSQSAGSDILIIYQRLFWIQLWLLAYK